MGPNLDPQVPRGIGCHRKFPEHHDLNTDRYTAVEASDRSQASSMQAMRPDPHTVEMVSHRSLSWLSLCTHAVAGGLGWWPV